jgi:hypothetical protein
VYPLNGLVRDLSTNAQEHRQGEGRRIIHLRTPVDKCSKSSLRQLGEGFEPTGEAPTERPARFSASIRERRPHSRV